MSFIFDGSVGFCNLSAVCRRPPKSMLGIAGAQAGGMGLAGASPSAIAEGGGPAGGGGAGGAGGGGGAAAAGGVVSAGTSGTASDAAAVSGAGVAGCALTTLAHAQL